MWFAQCLVLPIGGTRFYGWFLGSARRRRDGQSQPMERSSRLSKALSRQPDPPSQAVVDLDSPPWRGAAMNPQEAQLRIEGRWRLV
jgi:hypothetical protein